jgi:hypothetical protein
VVIFYIIKEFVQPKMILTKREFQIWKETRRGERGAGGQADWQVIFKVRLGLGEIEGRDREIERHTNKET